MSYQCYVTKWITIFKELTEGLKRNKIIVSLSLKENNINNVGLQLIGELFKVNTTITHLDLSDNPLNNVGGVKFSEALRVNGTITELILNRTRIKSDFLIPLLDSKNQHEFRLSQLSVVPGSDDYQE